VLGLGKIGVVWCVRLPSFVHLCVFGKTGKEGAGGCPVFKIVSMTHSCKSELTL